MSNNKGEFWLDVPKSAKIRDFLQGIPKTHLKNFRLRRLISDLTKNKGGILAKGGGFWLETQLIQKIRDGIKRIAYLQTESNGVEGNAKR